MRNSRIMAVLIVLCFMFAGASTLWALDYEAQVGSKHIKIKVKADWSKEEIKVKEGNSDEVDVTSITDETHGPVSNLRIMDNQAVENVRFINDSALIISGAGTCAWIFSGGTYHRYCW